MYNLCRMETYMKIRSKVLSALLCIAMILPLIGATSSLAGSRSVTYSFADGGNFNVISFDTVPVTRGDVNLDGKLSAKDSLTLKKYIAGQSVAIDMVAADSNGDGSVNTADLARVKKLITGSAAAVNVSVASSSVAYDSLRGAAGITALRNSPAVKFTFTSRPSSTLAAWAVISYKYSGASNTTASLSYNGGAKIPFALTKGDWKTAIVDMSGVSVPSGVSTARITFNVPSGEYVCIKYISFAATQSLAEQLAQNGGVSDDDPMASVIFDSAANAALLSGTNNTTVSYNSSQNAAAIRVSTASDPQSVINYDSASLSADEYKYIIITYMTPSSTSGSTSELFLCAGSVTAPTADCRETFTPTKDGNYHYAVISLASASYWTGKIHLIRLDPFTSCAAGDTLYIDSICLAKTRADASAIGFERLASRGAAAGVYTANTTLDGSSATISYFDASSISGAACTFSGGMTALINGNTKQFNRFCFDYSTNAIIRGVAYYSCDGVEYEDEFFLENTGGSTKTFRSLILPYFNGKKADGLSMICFYTINSSSATLTLSAITEETIAQQSQGTIFLSNSKYKLGIDLLMGGGVNYLEDFEDNNASYGNLLNNYDVGRLVQQSYYGIDRAPYTMGWWGGHEWRYNPVQGGDKANNISRIVDFEFTSGSEFYVKARPMDWGKENSATPSHMENIYTLTTSYVKVYNRFVDFSGYTHTNVRQELPAFYTISALKNFYYYAESSPWTGGSLTVKTDLPFWGDYPDQTTFNLSSNPEFWSAWCDASGYGVGLYVPGVYRLRAGRHQFNGTANPNADPTNYVSPQRDMTLICGKPIVYSYLITAGNINTIRSTFKDNKGAINNSSLVSYNN